jgi:hypothetical protein
MSPEKLEVKVEKLEAKIKKLEAKLRTTEELEAKLQTTRDIQEIERLQRMYGYYLDAKMMQEIVDLFSENAESVEIANRGVYLGKKGAARFFLYAQGQAAPGWRMARHFQLQGVTTVNPDGKTADGRWHILFLSVSNFGAKDLPPRACWGYGVYENKYVKENGKWLISKLHFNRYIYTPYDEGWLKTSDAGAIMYDPVIPDLPPTAYHPYPSQYVVPMHYKHPITGK